VISPNRVILVTSLLAAVLAAVLSAGALGAMWSSGGSSPPGAAGASSAGATPGEPPREDRVVRADPNQADRVVRVGPSQPHRVDRAALPRARVDQPARPASVAGRAHSHALTSAQVGEVEAASERTR
jgi:hypothetical protein